jgi:hypothetical protein
MECNVKNALYEVACVPVDSHRKGTGEYTDGGKLFKKKKLLYSTPAQAETEL